MQTNSTMYGHIGVRTFISETLGSRTHVSVMGDVSFILVPMWKLLDTLKMVNGGHIVRLLEFNVGLKLKGNSDLICLLLTKS
jgi:hypothetical protein